MSTWVRTQQLAVQEFQHITQVEGSLYMVLLLAVTLKHRFLVVLDSS